MAGTGYLDLPHFWNGKKNLLLVQRIAFHLLNEIEITSLEEKKTSPDRASPIDLLSRVTYLLPKEASCTMTAHQIQYLNPP